MKVTYHDPDERGNFTLEAELPADQAHALLAPMRPDGRPWALLAPDSREVDGTTAWLSWALSGPLTASCGGVRHAHHGWRIPDGAFELHLPAKAEAKKFTRSPHIKLPGRDHGHEDDR